MAFDKIVDSTQLDADLKSVADKIRAKCGTSAKLTFPDGLELDKIYLLLMVQI